MTYYSKRIVRKAGLKERTIIQIYQKDFPYPLADFFAENNTFENWLITQNQKSDELKIFEKIVILFQKKRDIHYGIFLALEKDKTMLKDFDLGKSIREITEISFIIVLLYQAIQTDFLKILKSQKSQLEADIEFHLYYDLKAFPKEYQKIQALAQ